MLQLAATTDKLQLTTSAAVNVDVHCSYVDHTLSSDNVEGNRQNTAISTATTTDILAAPGSGVVRRVKALTIRNKSNSTAVTVTAVFDANGTDYALHAETLQPGETLQYTEELGFFRRERLRLALPQKQPDGSGMTGDVSTTGASAAIVIPGSEVYFPNEFPVKAGTVIRWRGTLSKTAAGTAAGSFVIRAGTMPTLNGSTNRMTLPLSASTAASDVGTYDILVIIRSAGGSSTFAATAAFRHNLSTTGLFNLDHNVISQVSGTFDNSHRDFMMCLSAFANTTVVWTLQHHSTEVFCPP
jgi:hypothetical protein